MKNRYILPLVLVLITEIQYLSAAQKMLADCEETPLLKIISQWYRENFIGNTVFLPAGRDEEVERTILATRRNLIDATDDQGNTAMTYVACNFLLTSKENNENPILKKLIKTGASVNTQIKVDGNTPLHLAVKAVLPHTVSTLLYAGTGTDTTLKDKLGQTPFDLAVKLYHDENIDWRKRHRGKIVKMLADYNAETAAANDQS